MKTDDAVFPLREEIKCKHGQIGTIQNGSARK